MVETIRQFSETSDETDEIYISSHVILTAFQEKHTLTDPDKKQHSQWS